MPGRAPAGDPPVLAAAALDDFVAAIVRQARDQGLTVPIPFFDWARGEGTRLVERQLQGRPAPARATVTELRTALRCAVRYWVAPAVVAHFEVLRPLFPELSLQVSGAALHVLVRTGRWRCASGPSCGWRLCEARSGAGDQSLD